MTDNATPKTYSRPTKYPAAIPRTMTTTTQRDVLDAMVEQTGDTLGSIVRTAVDDGIALRTAYESDPGLREDVERMARDAGVGTSAALATMLAFAVRESRRRIERNARIAHGVAGGLAEMGFDVDGVTVGSVDVHAG